MPETLLGKISFIFIGSAACTTLILSGLEAWGYLHDNYQEKKKSEESERMGSNEMACEDFD